MPTFVSIDVETTGLDPQNDALLEIAAVKFNERRIEDEFSTLINPGRLIPREITQLTGITNEMVRNAPVVFDVIDEFASFVGDAPVVGHSVHFDLDFLKKQHVLQLNEAICTYELASVLLPTASRYNLEALAQLMNIYNPESHRALSDARTTQALFKELYEKCMQLPYEVVEEIGRLSEMVVWNGSWLFRQVLRQRVNDVFKSSPRKITQLGMTFTPPDEMFLQPLEPVDNPTPLDVDEVSSLLEYGGPFSRYFPKYEYRPQQLEMLQTVTKAISENQHLMVEAGTGTGKSYAYLIPAALWAMKNNMRVVISTNTINLQEQLIKKDVPELRAALDLNLRATVLKGRGNYICPRRFESFRTRGPENSDEIRVMGKIMVWLIEGGTGDRNEINLNGPIEREIWDNVSADDENCRVEVCMSRMEGVCPFYKAHRAAQGSHLVVVNHALLLADIATGSRVLPDYDYLIVDEAHHMEAATTGALSIRITQPVLMRMLHELGGINSGILGHTVGMLRNYLTPTEFALADQNLRRITDYGFRLDREFKDFFRAIGDFMAGEREHREITVYGQQARITPAIRKKPEWEEVEITWSAAEASMKAMLEMVHDFLQTAQGLNHLPDEVYDSLDTLNSLYRRLTEAMEQISGFAFKSEEGSIYWSEISPTSNQISLQVAPLHIGAMMEKNLWHEKSSVILTSATLTTSTGFDYLRNRLNADEADEYTVGSPFDYENSALLYLVNDIPEPVDRSNYQRMLDQIIMRLAQATGGRMLVLFTSYAQLKLTSKTITPYLEENGIYVYEQGKGASPNILLENFRAAEKAVLLGTRSFWEGVDIPGEALSVLVITRLPFEVPSDPVIAARSEQFEDPFHEYNLPEAVLRFRQGFGRLIRTQSDRGVVVVLDKRILSKSYGKLFIESLPKCTTRVDSAVNLPKAAQRWLNL